MIALWDLREPSSFHDLLTVGRSNQVFRSATFTTGIISLNNFELLEEIILLDIKLLVSSANIGSQP